MNADDDRVTLLMKDDLVRGTIASELNVKVVEAADDPREIAKLSAKANFRALGPRFGKRSPLAAERISAMTPAEIMTLRGEGRVELEVEGDKAAFTFEEVIVTEEGVGSFVAVGGQGLTVALDTALTENLLQEGLAREIINKVQNLRKKSGLEVSDRIELAIWGPQTVLEAVARFSDRIASETLARNVASERDLAYKETFKIDDKEIGIALEKV
jgi:isoleucyl-tRNA synthetase